MTSAPRPYGLIAEFATPGAVLRAAERVRDAGFRNWDVFTPFPVRGMDQAMGLKNSKVGWYAFLGGAAGYAAGMVMIGYMNAFDYRIPVGGKPMFSPFAALPTAFELTILCGAVGACLGLLGLNRLPRLHHPLLKHPRFALATCDRFFLVIECQDPRYLASETRRLLEAVGSERLELVED